MNQLSMISDWYDGLPQRERALVVMTSVIVIVTLFFLLVWEPIYKGLDEERIRLENQTNSLNWMLQAEKEVKALKVTGAESNRRKPNSPVSLSIEQSAASTGVKNFLTKTESSGNNSARATLDGVSFNQMIIWINTLEQNFGVLASSVNIENTDKPGIVDARISFNKAE